MMTFVVAFAGLCAPPTAAAGALAAVRAALKSRGGPRPLAEVGELLRSGGVALPADAGRLSNFVRSHPEELVLSGPPHNLRVGLAEESRAASLVATVRAVLLEHGPAMTAAELKQRLSERRRFVPGLRALLLAHPDLFAVDGQLVRLRRAAGAVSGGVPVSAPAALERLRSVGLGTEMDGDASREAARAREVVVIDMDNKAFTLEAAAQRAASAPASDVMVLAFCATGHNPRVPAACAAQLRELSLAGRMRLLAPLHDAPNAADFVLAFWAGWLHRTLPAEATLLLVSTDIHLERTVRGVLEALGRGVASNPAFLEPAGGIALAAAAAAAAADEDGS